MALDLSKAVKAEEILASNIDEIKQSVIAGKTPDAKANRIKKVFFAIMDNGGSFVSKDARNLAADLTLDSDLANIIGYVKAGETPKAGTFFGKRPAEKKDASGKVTNSSSSVKYDTIATVVENANNHDYRIGNRDVATTVIDNRDEMEEEPVDTRIADVDAAWDEAIKDNAEFDKSAKEDRSAAEVLEENKEFNELQKVKKSRSLRTIVLGSVAVAGLVGTVVGSTVAGVRGGIINDQNAVIENYDQLSNEMLSKASEILKDYQITNEYALPIVGIDKDGNRVNENDENAVKHAIVISTNDNAKVAREYVAVLTEAGYNKYLADEIELFTVADFASPVDAYNFAFGVNDIAITNTAKRYIGLFKELDISISDKNELEILVDGAQITIKNLRDSYVKVIEEHNKCAIDIAGLQMQLDEVTNNLESTNAEKEELQTALNQAKATEESLNAQLKEKGDAIAELQNQLDAANQKLAEYETQAPDQGNESVNGGNNSGIIVDDSNKNEGSSIDKGEDSAPGMDFGSNL